MTSHYFYDTVQKSILISMVSEHLVCIPTSPALGFSNVFTINIHFLSAKFYLFMSLTSISRLNFPHYPGHFIQNLQGKLHRDKYSFSKPAASRYSSQVHSLISFDPFLLQPLNLRNFTLFTSVCKLFVSIGYVKSSAM